MLKKILSILSDLLVPENRELAKLLEWGPSEWRKILPKAVEIDEEDTFPIFSYQNKNVRKIVWAVKYKKHPVILERVAEIMYEEILSLAEERLAFAGKNNIALVPVPMGAKTERQRGWNQTEELCMEISKISKGEIKVLNILEKSRETEHQTSLTRSERLKNMKDGIKLKEGNMERLKDFLLIIVDDVYTTGATIKEAKRALKQAGYPGALAITIAH